MSNYDWVCFDCRQSMRRPGYDFDVRCSSCGEQAVCLGTKVEVPPKSKAARWKALHEQYLASGRWWAQYRYKATVRRTHDLEQEIARLSAMPENSGRQSRIKRLRTELASIKGGV